MPQRKKSINDINRQLDKILSSPAVSNERAMRAAKAAARYKQNIVDKRGVKQTATTPNGNSFTRIFIDGDKKFARSTYMGKNSG